MIELSQAAIEAVASPPLVPSSRPIDLMHLSRMTLGDRALEREVLSLFDRQMSMLMDRIETGQAPVAAAAAHTLKGSATGIGAFALARLAAEVERAAGAGEKPAREQAVAGLRTAMREARADIVELLAVA